MWYEYLVYYSLNNGEWNWIGSLNTKISIPVIKQRIKEDTRTEGEIVIKNIIFLGYNNIVEPEIGTFRSKLFDETLGRFYSFIKSLKW